MSDRIAEIKTVHCMVGHMHFASISDSADAIGGSRMLET